MGKTKIIFKYDKNKDKYLIDDKEVTIKEWIITKNMWEIERSYNCCKKYIEKWGFTNCEFVKTIDFDVYKYSTIMK